MLIRAIFIISLCFFAFMYGFAAHRNQLWPYGVFKEARLAWDALLAVGRDELLEIKPVMFEYFDEGGYTAPVVKVYGEADNNSEDLILIGGGPHQLTSHCPQFGCLAWIINRNGDVKHVWEVDPEVVWGDIDHIVGFNKTENIYPVGFHLFKNGYLLVSYQGINTFPFSVGLAKFDKNSNLLWKREDLSHHWFSVDDKGFIYTPSHELLESPLSFGKTRLSITCLQGKIYGDLVRVLDSEGNQVDQISIMQTLLESDKLGLLYWGSSPDAGVHPVSNCDPLHLNDVRVLTADEALSYSDLSLGDLLISLRHPSVVALIDRQSKLIKWLSHGQTVLQHSPRFLGDNQILIFDNLGGVAEQGGSRLVKLDRSNKAEIIFPKPTTPAEVSFFTANAGYIGLHVNKRRALVSLTRQGRVLEIDLETGKILWEYINTHDIYRFLDKTKQQGKRFVRFGTNFADYIERPVFPMNQIN